MTSTKNRQIYPSDEVPEVFARMGRDPLMGCPLGWVEKLVQDVRRTIPTESERGSVVVHGLDGVTMTYTDELTPAEQMADELAELRRLRQAAASMLPRTGESMTADQVDALRRALAGA